MAPATSTPRSGWPTATLPTDIICWRRAHTPSRRGSGRRCSSPGTSGHAHDETHLQVVFHCRADRAQQLEVTPRPFRIIREADERPVAGALFVVSDVRLPLLRELPFAE